MAQCNAEGCKQPEMKGLGYCKRHISQRPSTPQVRIQVRYRTKNAAEESKDLRLACSTEPYKTVVNEICAGRGERPHTFVIGGNTVTLHHYTRTGVSEGNTVWYEWDGKTILCVCGVGRHSKKYYIDIWHDGSTGSYSR